MVREVLVQKKKKKNNAEFGMQSSPSIHSLEFVYIFNLNLSSFNESLDLWHDGPDGSVIFLFYRGMSDQILRLRFC